MPDYLQRESNKITIANFYEGFELEKFNFEPPYQRRSLWSDEKKSFLIDSIIKNYPMPPIFLHQKINDDTGKTLYDVIDGKQRLTAIVDFIQNKIPITDDEDEDPSVDNPIAGCFFRDFDGGELSDYKSRFWRYIIPVEYVDTGDSKIIDSIFDRLNRNGEPLRGQELRHSNYYGTPLINLIEESAKELFWKETLSTLDHPRMQEIEFLSELVFLIIEGHELHANQKELDALYKEYADKPTTNYSDLQKDFREISSYMESLRKSSPDMQVNGVSHLYGLFAFSHHCVKKNVESDKIIPRLNDFFALWKSKNYENPEVSKYKESMSSRTRSSGQRKKRTEALIEFCIENPK